MSNTDNTTNKTSRQIRWKLWWGLGYLLLGLAMAFAGWRLDTSGAISLGCGFGGAGLGLLGRFWFLSRNPQEYEGRLRREHIEAHDEMLVLLRRQAGHLTYLLTVVLLFAAVLLAAVCYGLELVLPFSRYCFYITLAALILEYICGVVIFNWLKSRY